MKSNAIMRLSVSLFSSALLSACAYAPLTTDAADCGCTNSSCASNVTITYGVNNSQDSVLKVKEKAEVKKEQLALVFKLDPKNGPRNYDTTTVTVVGKPGAGNPNAWITQTSGKYDPDKELVICVPTTIKTGDYFYDIDVDGFGKLDPRVNVTR
ncbi:MAG: hypothetical protein OQK01_10785 [Xanthomonadales bacterium]|jgi:hypothetical protein|nr:hypothetical protein [Xanthomonadales bacterium]